MIKATALALTAAGAILVVAVLPAEYGKDLTGLGQVLGLTDLVHRMHQSNKANKPLSPCRLLPRRFPERRSLQ